MLAVILLSGLFSDHMVLQRGRSNPLWGTDQPRQVITLTVEGAKPAPAPVQVSTAADGTWKIICPELPAGGPYRLHLSGSSERVINDVLSGDVWLASGQSNMEFPLSRAMDADHEIAAANWPEIRFAKIPLIAAHAPRASVDTAWNVTSPTTAATFTAVGYFFAREIHRRMHVPVGIIDSTWGGTRVEAWTSREGLRGVIPGIDQELGQFAGNEAERERIRAEYLAKRAAWEKTAFPQDTTHVGEEQGWAQLAFDDHAWRTMVLPTTWQAQGFNANGCVWFRRKIAIPADEAGRDLVLHLGAIDDFDTSFWNGERIGAIQQDTPDAYQKPRVYTVPGRLVHAGENVIAVRVFDRYGDGGMMGPAVAMFVESSVHPGERQPLNGPWRWQVEREIPLVSGDVYNSAPPIPAAIDDQNAATSLFNGMIAPLVPYGLRGVIWYQGEANVRQHATYRDRFTAMIRDWRGRWGEGTLPFYFVQLASFTENAGWPYLREAQTETLAEPATGMAVTIDLGEIHNIHPRNKQEVGRRLALAALHQTYGEKDLVASGPTLAQVEMTGSSARVRWHHATGLRTRDHARAVLGFELAGADGVYHAADAHLEGETVVVSSAAVPQPHNVRYAWADYVDVNLENSEGLPATPFRTDGF